jgi:cytochrome c peroxidase
MLSRDFSISCADCHRPFAAFADPGHTFSHGINNQLTQRNSPPLYNLAWHPLYMFDGGIHHLDLVSLAPIMNPLEMDNDLETVINRIRGNEEYMQMFKKAFNEIPDIPNTMRSLGYFMAMLVSDQTRYDKFLNGNENALSQLEKKGLEIFRLYCTDCHTEPLLSNFRFENNGIKNQFSDVGRQLITGLDSDLGKFKIPSLRNVELTHPYMHDGSIKDLEQVVEHYSSGVLFSETLSPKLPVGGFQFDSDQKSALVAFLKSLTDERFINEPKFQDPNFSN